MLPAWPQSLPGLAIVCSRVVILRYEIGLCAQFLILAQGLEKFLHKSVPCFVSASFHWPSGTEEFFAETSRVGGLAVFNDTSGIITLL